MEDLTKKREEKIKDLWQKSKERAAQELAAQENYLYIDLKKTPIETSALSLVPEQTAKQANVAVFQKIGNKIKIAVLDPSDFETLKVISDLEKQGYKVIIFVATKESLNEAWKNYAFVHYRPKELSNFIEITETEPVEFNDLHQKLLSLPSDEVTSLVSLILKSAVITDASDIHIEPQEEQALIRFRVDGVLYDVSEIDKRKYEVINQRLKLLSGLKLNIKTISQNGRFTIQNNQDFIDVRASSLPGPEGEFLVFRLLNPRRTALGLADLGISKNSIEIFEHILSAPNGMILITGPTGSGKTTTLYAFLKRKVSPGIKIITIEDPIEYHIPGVNQTQVSKKYDFENGLKSILRQDPDVIMIGEMRDKETVKTAIQASLTGHLVFSTLHTNEACGAISRLKELEAEPSIISNSLKLVIAQRLVRRLCPYCKEQYEPSPDIKEQLIEALSILSPKSKIKIPKDIPPLFKAKGCEKCHWLGYKGQIGIFEYFIMTPRMIRAIEEEADQNKLRTIAIDEGMVPLFHDGLIKIIEGITSLEEIIRVAGDISYVQELYKELFSQILVRGVKVNNQELKQIEKLLQEDKPLQPLLKDKPSEKQIALILATALKSRATDVHFEPEEKNTQIRQRIDGVLHPLVSFDIKEHPKIINELKSLGGLKTEETQKVQEGRFRLILPDKSFDLRLSIVPGGYGEGASLRILGGETALLDLEKIGFLPSQKEKIEKTLEKKVGLILAAGPTSSGKTTTLFSILKKLAKPDVKIITVEDPIEYRLPGITQTQINEEKGYTFAKALRSLLRQNPNIFLIGEIRDKETAELVWQASSTGHLVLSTIHTNDALGVLSRLKTLGIPPQELISNINVIIAQRLIRCLCPNCKKKIKIPKEIAPFIKQALKKFPEYKQLKQTEYISEPKGCPQCNFTGYQGQTGIFEILIPPPGEKDLSKVDFPKLIDDAIIKLLQGVTSWEEIKRVLGV
ncbi:MAG: GspE/PulE family protein [Candidatus Paceibacterota bacterium]|jgi:type II secretory ATPase GspE/PulE/Tfp pilus assembly ATPase PilB-like protein